MATVNPALAHALLDLYDTAFPGGSTLELRSGRPSNAKTRPAGRLLCAIELPMDPWTPASRGRKTNREAWVGIAQDDGEVGHYRLRNAATGYIEEGVVPDDLSLDNPVIADGQSVTVTQFAKQLLTET